MAPKSDVSNALRNPKDEEIFQGLEELPKDEHPSRTYEIVWKNVLTYIYIHAVSLYALYLICTSANYKTTVWAFVLLNVGDLAITGGVHRLWCHRTYKAGKVLRVFYLLASTMAFQESVITWCRDHRLHHKCSDTHGDPHNPSNGFFYAHVGWLLTRKHPEVRVKGKNLHMSDLTADQMLSFQHRHYLPLMVLLAFVLPVATPMYLWNETFVNAFVLNVLRYTCGLNITWLINSAGHMYGQKPYDRNINPRENRAVSFVSLGEGWHNYHHAFPWDYKASELGKQRTNLTAAFIELMAKLGLAHGLKFAPPEVILKRVQRTGG